MFLHGSNNNELSLADFAREVASLRPQYIPRGREPSGPSFTFFRRRKDGSIDEENLKARTEELSRLLFEVAQRHGQPALLIGFSSGAITAAALMARHPAPAAGAILLRPQIPFAENCFPDLTGTPVLIVSARNDERRKRSDAAGLVNLLMAANAEAEWHELACGHGLDPEGGDIELTRAWLAKRGS
uniref:Alpha/beta hydrolase n=1 Tax=Agrobacterium albertimagni TaxID=147266 RepID=A0A7C1PFS3_9HYPH